MVEAYFHKDKLINVILNAFRLMNEDNLIDDVEVVVLGKFVNVLTTRCKLPKCSKISVELLFSFSNVFELTNCKKLHLGYIDR